MTKIILRNQGLILLATIALSSCGGGGGGALTQSDFCSKKAEAECKGVATKCVATTDACKAVRVATCNAFALEQQMNPSALARPFRPELAQDCLNKTTAVYAKPTITPADRLPMEIACARVFSGKKKDTDTDKTCINDYECDASQICDLGFGLCAVKKSVAGMANCNNPGDVCPATEYCNTATPRDCVARPTVGMPCSPPAIPCLDTQRCAAGVCAERVGIGMTCGSDSDCKPEAPYCDSYSGKICVAGFTPSTGVPECVMGFGGVMPGGGTGGSSGGGSGGAGGAGGAP